MPLQLRGSDKKTLLWKNPKPNSNRQTKILRSQWVAETSQFVVETHTSLEDEIKKVVPLEIDFEGVKIKAQFEVLNCMNDGKVIYAVSTEHFKRIKVIPQTAKSISFQVCHLCGQSTNDFKHSHRHRIKYHHLIPLGFAPMHVAKNSCECLLNSAFRKSAIKSFGTKNKTTLKEAQNIMCEKLRLETGARLFEPEPAKKDNSNTGQNLKQVTRYPKAAAKILDCSEQLISLLHEFLGMLESLETQNADELEEMGKQVFELFKHDFGEFSKLSPSFHRAVAHSGEVARYFQAQGFTIGELSECAQEAINAPTKKDVAQFSFRGSHKKQNLGCLKRNWAFSDPLTMEYAE